VTRRHVLLYVTRQRIRWEVKSFFLRRMLYETSGEVSDTDENKTNYSIKNCETNLLSLIESSLAYACYYIT
jgi:hypothetical protein